VQSSPSTARTIFVIRHGEKPYDDVRGVDLSGRHNEHSLIPVGWQRAGALAHLFSPRVPGFAVPTELIAPKYNAATDDEHRTHQTILPLAGLLGLPIHAKHKVGHEEALAEELEKSTAAVTLVCWEHQAIPTIAQAIAPGADIPECWPDARFDVAWRFTREPMEPVAGFAQLPEMLLAGDSDTPIPVAPE
jgi:hypothetical protein